MIYLQGVQQKLGLLDQSMQLWFLMGHLSEKKIINCQKSSKSAKNEPNWQIWMNCKGFSISWNYLMTVY